MIGINKIYKGDCLELMGGIDAKSIDMILCDLPYGTTACKWDSVIPFDRLWAHYRRIIKDNGAIVLTAIQPFTSALVMSNLDMFKYNLVWNKTKVSHFAQAPYRPLTEHEDILVFSFGGTAKNSKNRMRYNPQGTTPCNKVVRGKDRPSDHRPNRAAQNSYLQTTTNYPKSILKVTSDPGKDHPTQKPVALFEYLIKTYTNEGELVLDNCAGSGTTAIACLGTDRNYILMEKDDDYFELARNRVLAHELGITYEG